MHLVELIAELEAVKVARGNVKLVDVIVMASGDQRPIADYADRAAARSKAPQLAIDVSGMSEDQIEEIRAENPGAKLVSVPVDHSNKPSEPCPVAGCIAGTVGHEGECEFVEPEREFVQCNIVDVTRGRCTLAIGHEVDAMRDLDHVWEYPERKPAPGLLRVPIIPASDAIRGATSGAFNVPATALGIGPAETLTIGPVSTNVDSGGAVVVDEMRIGNTPRCEEVYREAQCILSAGHDCDHDFVTPSAAELAKVMEDAAAKLPGGADPKDEPAK